MFEFCVLYLRIFEFLCRLQFFQGEKFRLIFITIQINEHTQFETVIFLSQRIWNCDYFLNCQFRKFSIHCTKTEFYPLKTEENAWLKLWTIHLLETTFLLLSISIGRLFINWVPKLNDHIYEIFVLILINFY